MSGISSFCALQYCFDKTDLSNAFDHRVCFAKQAPGSGVQSHSDGRNFILTSHLGLKVPEECWIEVGGERRGWEKGRLTTLDTSFAHSTGNPAESDRHVLIIDFWHPELSKAEVAALEYVYDVSRRSHLW